MERSTCNASLASNTKTWSGLSTTSTTYVIVSHIVLSHSPLKSPQALDRLDPFSPASRKCLRELRTICSSRVILPPSYALPSRLLEINSVPFASGGSGDVYKGSLDGSSVCVKRIRVYTKDVLQTAAKVCF